MHDLTALIQADMKISLGVTEPGAIALAAAKAKSLTEGNIRKILLEVNSGIYKNAFTCGIPNTEETGNLFAAALGALAGEWEKGLAALEHITPQDVENARALIQEKKVEVRVHEISSDLFIKVSVKTDKDCGEVWIEGAHDQITKVVKNGETLIQNACQQEEEEQNKKIPAIARYTLADFWEYSTTVEIEELEFIEEAFTTNLLLMEEGRKGKSSVICKEMIVENGGMLRSKNSLMTAQAMTAAAIEARVRGYDKPAMSITGSGNHGILCTIPIYAYGMVNESGKECMYRAVALSYLVTMYIKEYSGKLSAFCGCAIAAGTGAAVGQLYMEGGNLEQAGMVIRNMASSLTGMICTGGNTACILKAAIAIDIGNRAVRLAKKGIAIEEKHGINGFTPEQTMRYMGEIAYPGMTQTEGTIIRILQEKMQNAQ